jgi:heme-degrading monooxygenase HmoA
MAGEIAVNIKKRKGKMVRIHIRRKVSEENQEELKTLINQMRATILGNAGYLSGETLKRIDEPGEILVVSKWQSHFYWKQWYESREREEIQARIDRLLEAPTQYEVYEYE